MQRCSPQERELLLALDIGYLKSTWWSKVCIRCPVFTSDGSESKKADFIMSNRDTTTKPNLCQYC